MYDIVFISYKEKDCDQRFDKLKSEIPYINRIHGVKGIHNAHIKAAELCKTKLFYVIDGDADVLDSFDFSYVAPEHQQDHVHVWQSINPINDLVYGYGGVKLLPRRLTLNMDLSKPDMTTSISNNFLPMSEVSNVSAFNTDPYSVWRSAFRECAKLASKTIQGQLDKETDERLETWTTKGLDRPFGDYAIAGAVMGKRFGLDNPSDISKINDFDWLETQFKEA